MHVIDKQAKFAGHFLTCIRKNQIYLDTTVLVMNIEPHYRYE